MDDDLLARLADIVTTDESRPARAGNAAELILRSTPARWVGIYSVADNVVTSEGWAGPGAPAYPTFPATKGLTAHAIHAASIAVSNDVAADPRYLTNQDDSGSELIVPIIDSGRVVGTLDIESGHISAFDGAEIARYEALAGALLALWNAAESGDSV